MNRLVWINLTIDQLWNESSVLRQLFPARIPSSLRLVRSNEDLGIFRSEPNDTVLLASEADQDFKTYLSGFFPLPRMVPIRSHPIDIEAFITETQNQLSSERPLLTEGLFAGISALENRLIQTFNLAESPLKRDLFVTLNQKSFLYEWTKKTKIPFPVTQLVETLEWSKLQKLNEPYLLKPEMGSGGAGQWPQNRLNEKLIQRLQLLAEDERIRSGVKTRWLIQQQHPRAFDFCAYGHSRQANNDLHYCEIIYDHHGLSQGHKYSPDLVRRVPELESALQALSSLFNEVGYQGPFGIDGFVSQTGDVFPLIDLNARLTKTHLLHAAAKRLNVFPWNALRFRWQGPKRPFSSWWSALREKLGLDSRGDAENGLSLRPIVVSAMTTRWPDEDDIGPNEVQIIFGSHSDQIPWKPDWPEMIVKALSEVPHEI